MKHPMIAALDAQIDFMLSPDDRQPPSTVGIFDSIPQPITPQPYECGQCDAPPCMGKCKKIDVSGVIHALTERQRDQRWVEEQRAKNFCAALGPHWTHLRGCDDGHPIHALAEDAE